MIGSRLTRGCGFWHDWRQILLMVLTFVILAATQSFCEAAEPTDVTGTWGITQGIVRGKPIDMNELKGYTAVVDETTWVELECQRKTTYYYKTDYVAKQTRLKLCHDAELEKIEALAIVRIRDGLLECCMIDYSPGVQYPTAFESTEKNKCELFTLKPIDRATKPSTAADNSTYSGRQVEVRDVTLTNSGKVQITFTTMPETLYYCPGANGETTEEGTLLTFVRSFVKMKPQVDYPAKRKGDPAKTWDQLILVDAKDKPIFVKSGKDLLKIFPADTSAAVGAAIVIEARFTATSGDDTDLLSASQVTTRTGQKASIKAVTERHCSNDEIVEEGVILNVTPTVENGVVTLMSRALHGPYRASRATLVSRKT